MEMELEDSLLGPLSNYCFVSSSFLTDALESIGARNCFLAGLHTHFEKSKGQGFSLITVDSAIAALFESSNTSLLII